MPSITCAILCRNEARPDRYLRKVLARCREFADRIVVLDDQSTDATPDVCREYGAIVQTRDVSGAWGNESVARAELFDLAVQHCPDAGGWVLFCDCDMVLHGDPCPLAASRDCNAWAWPLFDLWDSEQTYRSDEYWRGHEVPRVWMVRRPPNSFVPEWNGRGIHCGHIPPNYPLISALAPPDVYWLHYGWLQPTHRAAKYAQYMQTADQLSPFELAHVQSILAPT